MGLCGQPHPCSAPPGDYSKRIVQHVINWPAPLVLRHSGARQRLQFWQRFFLHTYPLQRPAQVLARLLLRCWGCWHHWYRGTSPSQLCRLLVFTSSDLLAPSRCAVGCKIMGMLPPPRLRRTQKTKVSKSVPEGCVLVSAAVPPTQL